MMVLQLYQNSTPWSVVSSPKFPSRQSNVFYGFCSLVFNFRTQTNSVHRTEFDWVRLIRLSSINSLIELTENFLVRLCSITDSIGNGKRPWTRPFAPQVSFTLEDRRFLRIHNSRFRIYCSQRLQRSVNPRTFIGLHRSHVLIKYRYLIQNLRTCDQTGTYLFRVHA